MMRAPERVIEQRYHLVLVEPAHRGEQAEVEVATDDCGNGEKILDGPREPRQSLADHVANARRRRGATCPELRQHRRARQAAHQLVQEERIAVRLLVQQRREICRRAVCRHPRGADQQFAHRVDVETDEMTALDRAHARQVAEGFVEQLAPIGAGVAVGGDHHDSVEIGCAENVPEQEQRRSRGPVEVVDDEHHRPAPGRRPQPRDDGLEQLIALGVGIGMGRRLDVAEARAQRRRQSGELSGVGAERLGQQRVGSVAREEVEHVDERLERRADPFVATAEEHRPAVVVRERRGLRGESRLADAGFARYEHRLDFAVFGRSSERLEPLDLGRTPGERRVLVDPQRPGNRHPLGPLGFQRPHRGAHRRAGVEHDACRRREVQRRMLARRSAAQFPTPTPTPAPRPAAAQPLRRRSRR